MKGFLLLIRPINLLIIALTMYSVRLFILMYEKIYCVQFLGQNGEELNFFLLVLSTVMIAAGGNVINDYFDVRADRINKPKRVIIGKYINSRWAILIHSGLNFMAFAIAVYLSVRYETFWYVFIHLLTMNALWLYSLFLKKKPIIGNFLIAGLTALVPILCGVHFYVQGSVDIIEPEIYSTAFEYWLISLLNHGYFIWLLAFFAFVNNFAREIIKDGEDIKGDQMISAKTLPIQYGVKVSKIWIVVLLLLPLVLFTVLFLFHQPKNDFGLVDQILIFMPVIISLLMDFVAIGLTIRATTKTRFLKADQWVKYAMVSGVITSLYWYLLWM
ncbi:geranylgeranylglycerol-phosphate geranylgeranyltransferase [Crocinitomicaceae bacterium]|nr:geranylgeranylglycerol-phosphate geranylgeranyltransferase [Crocinitomicaceae bacterium]